MKTKTDVIIVGTGAAGLFCAINLPKDMDIILITKDDVDKSDSFLAQGGICVLKDENDFDSFYDDTMKAGHYENKSSAVETMINNSREVIENLISCGVDFAKDEKGLLFTKEGGHSTNRILFHKDITGKEITGKLLEKVREKRNVTIYDHCTMTDLSISDGKCHGIYGYDRKKNFFRIDANYTVLACGGVGGLYEHSTNYSHITGDGVAVALRHNVEVQNLDYVQIHPTTLYSKKPGRRFLISESVRGEGAILLDKNMERFTNELLPRDVLTQQIRKQMKKDGTEFVWLSMENIPEQVIREHFPNIYKHCLGEGYDVTKEPIPVVPAQHYFMGGIKVDLNSKTSTENLYAVGETSCNGVHGANRLASNSLLESLVFSKRAAKEIEKLFRESDGRLPEIKTPPAEKKDTEHIYRRNREIVIRAIEEEKNKNAE